MVGTSRTGHAESVEITYDPSKVTYGQMLQVYLLGRAQSDRAELPGSRPRHPVPLDDFAENDEQQKIAQSYIAQLDKAKVFPGPIVTTLETGKAFYPAEDYHQDYLTLNPTYPYIVYNDLPKVANLKQLFPALYSEKPVLVLAAERN